MDINKAFVADQGVMLGEDETQAPFVFGGANSPVGLTTPNAQAFYVQTVSDGVCLWKKFGPNPNDWVKMVTDHSFSIHTFADCISIPANQEMQVSSLCIEETGALGLDEFGALTLTGEQ